MHRPTTRALVGTATQPELVFRRSYRATPADVMQACTDPERLARWFGAIHGTAVAVGDRFTVDLGGGEADTATCQVLRCEEDSVSVSWAWQDEPLSTLTARVRSDGDGLTELTLQHALAQPDHLAGYGGGWEQLLQSLARSLDDAAPDSPEDAEVEAGAARAWRVIGHGPIELVQDVAAPRERVWSAFTTAEGLTSWWWRHWEGVSIAVDARVGGAYRMDAPAQGITISGRFLVVDPPSRLALSWVWQDDDGATADEAVDIRLVADGTGTRVHLRHSGPWPEGSTSAESYRQGWEFTLGQLADVVADD